jgi:hypothetical protein
MRGNIRKEPTDTVELARVRHAEECELRLARIQNGAEPGHRNGPWPIELIHVDNSGWRWFSQSGRKSPSFRSEQNARDWRAAHPKWD